MTVRLYTRRGCPLCDDALRVLETVRSRSGFALETVDIDADDDLRREYGWDVPVVAINGEDTFYHRVSETALLGALAQREKGPA